MYRHESLRTRIVGAPEAPRQIVDGRRQIELPIIDISGLHPTRRLRTAQQLSRGFIAEEIGLETGPLFATRILKLSDHDHVLLVGVDHFVSDAVSFSIITREVLMHYRQLDGACERSCPQPRLQYPDFAVWQDRTQDAWVRNHLHYWKSRLSNVPMARIPVDNDYSSDKCPPRECLYIPFGRVLSAGLKETARRERTLTPLIVLSLQLAIMSNWCGRCEFLVEFFTHGRNERPEMKEMIGFLAYPMYLRVEIVPSETFGDLVRHVTEEFYSACAHDASHVTGNLVTDSPTEIFFNWISTDGAKGADEPADMEKDLEIRPFPVPKERFAIFAPHYYQTPSGVVGEIWYGRGLFERRTLEWFENRLRGMAGKVIQHSNISISSL